MNEVEHLRIELMHAKQVPNKGHLKEGKSVMYLLDPNMEKEIQNLQLLVCITDTYLHNLYMHAYILNFTYSS